MTHEMDGFSGGYHGWEWRNGEKWKNGDLTRFFWSLEGKSRSKKAGWLVEPRNMGIFYMV